MASSPSPSPKLRSTTSQLAVAGTGEEEERRPLLRDAASVRSSSPPLFLSPSPPSWRETVAENASEIWAQGKGMILVMISQFFGSSMNVMTQVLELKGRNGEGWKPFQILFARMSITVLASYLYMWYAKVPHPFGTRPMRPLLVFRAAGGFWGVYGLYYSVQYLPLSEATVLTFLAPILSCYACSFFIPSETFTRKQQLAGLVSLIGVVLIARPFPFLRFESQPNSIEAAREKPGEADQYHRILAICAALMGVLGASSAYTAIRTIGQRCHPLVSVTYFSLFTTIVSFIAIMVMPSIPLEFPTTALEWSLLIGLGVCGFLLQFLLTAGLAYVPPPPRQRRRHFKPSLVSSSTNRSYGTADVEDSDGKPEPEAETQPTSSGSRATSMLYTQMLFALFYDSTIWGETLSAVSWAGSALILASAIYVAMAREPPPETPPVNGGSDGEEPPNRN